ncbi:Photosystem II [Handroanthus impetiginosus]|uniref:Photosystem II n=1 Tax=Handroanthus impetiginosus TaxID=429701 RepID=A0A2G9FWQ0_9LAMI|nr:Photosystem II [Handroanthus impetiginosus]PIN14212.1 Photosystem II [Handroanthus impetiginosus]
MATALPSIKSHHSLIPNLPLFRNNANRMSISTQKKPKIRAKMRTVIASLSDSSISFPQNGILRRDLMFMGLSSSLSLIFPTLDSSAVQELKMDLLVDDINAYSYLYPTELSPNKFVFKWVESRKPERYSSAAPLSPDARLRIVSERVDFIDNLIISVTIGPPNSLFLKSKEKSTWSAKDVADSVLADKSALRVTSRQRMDESSVLDAHSSTVDGEPYWYYEYLVRKSPTKLASEPNLYRHFVASTAERDGYLYTLNASTLSKQWDKMGPFLEKTVASFRLLPPTENYVPPYKDPWRFW